MEKIHFKQSISNDPSKPRFLLYVSSRPVNTRWRQVQNSKLIRGRNDLDDDIIIIYIKIIIIKKIMDVSK